MPPPQHILGSRFRGFVCRSCLSKLQTPQRQRVPWLARSISTDVARTKGDLKEQRKDGEQEATPTANVKYWDQFPDGTRKQIHPDVEDAEEKELRETVETEVRNLEEKEGRSIDDIMADAMGSEKNVEAAMTQRMSEIMESGPEVLGINFGPSEEEEADLDARIKEIKAQMAIIKSYGGIENMRDLSEEQRLSLRDILLAPMRKREKEGEETQSHIIHAAPSEAKLLPKKVPFTLTQESVLIPVDVYPGHAHARITQLNDALYPTTAAPKKPAARRRKGVSGKAMGPKDNIQEIWRAYILCRSTLLDAPQYVPSRTWHALWNKLAQDDPQNTDRMAHIKYLGDDMRQAGVPLHPRERLLYIEAIFIDNDRNLAIKAWEDLKADDDYHLDTAHHHTDKRFFQVSYWELGIRMFSLTGQPDRAFEAARALFNVTQEPAAYRALIPILRAYLTSDDPKSCQRAWALYVQLRLKLGARITMDDYDIVISHFMNSNQPYLALGVFRDMMVTGDQSLQHRDSISSYRKTADVDSDFGREINATELDWKNPKFLSSLPPRFNNKYFFGSWIKKLIGDGEIDLAKKVFDLMEDRGITPSPVHLNGLIGAWFREGGEKYRQMAETTAWKMIHSRTEFVRKREGDEKFESWEGLEGPLRVLKSHDLPNAKSLAATPHATIETFAILIQQYRRRQRHDLTLDLFTALRRAKVKPNTSFLNELLLSDSRNQNVGWAWQTYQSLTSSKQVRPDFETFIILWDLSKKNISHSLHNSDDRSIHRFPTGRQLFANMTEHLTSKALRLKISKELYDSIILSFSLAEDQIGTAVALRALRRHYNALPSQDTVRMIVYQLAQLGIENAPDQKVRRLNVRSETTQERIAKVTKILQKFKGERTNALSERGIAFAQLSDIEKLEETEILLSDLLRYVSRARYGSSFNSTEACQKAAEQMGVPDCTPWE